MSKYEYKRGEQILFHGGCHGCTQQEEKGLEFCVGCQYFNADWSLPSWHSTYIRRKLINRINKIKEPAPKVTIADLMKEVEDSMQALREAVDEPS